MGLTPEQLVERRTRIGGSDAGKIVSGEWLPLWLEKTARSEPEDLSWVLPVQIGVATEPLNLAFFEHATGHKTFGHGEVYVHPDHPFIGCTIDGLALIDGKPAIVQCKHVNPFAKIEEIEQRYYPQVAHEMFVTGASLAFLSVFLGTQKHEIVEVKRDREYTTRLLELEVSFWDHVLSDTAPAGQEGLAMPEKPTVFRTLDMTGSNAWANHSADWLANAAAAKICDKAAKGLRELVAADVGRAFGHGVEIKRSRDNKLLLGTMK